jgi:hypothetical protein
MHQGDQGLLHVGNVPVTFVLSLEKLDGLVSFCRILGGSS